MRKLILTIAIMLFTTSFARADINNCQGVYVGAIWVEKGNPLKGVVFLNSPGDASGSYVVWFDGWSTDDKKAALALLTSAKVAQLRVDVATEDASQCAITSSGRVLKSVILSNN